MTRRAESNILYMTYDGLTDPLGQSQVLPYVLGLTRRGYRFHVISAEKRANYERLGADIRDRLTAKGIKWHPVSYTKRPPILSTIYDSSRMTRHALRLHSKIGFSLVHCRGYITALTGLTLQRRAGVRFVFDMRGFWADEKVDAGAWPQANPAFRAVYRFFKGRERAFLEGANASVILTRAAADALARRTDVRVAGPVPVIPCSVDFDAFRPFTDDEHRTARLRLGVSNETLVLAYLGSLGTWYMIDEMMEFFASVRRKHPDARLVLITPDAPAIVTKSADRHGIPHAALIIRSVPHNEVRSELAAADAGVFFIRPTPSKIASSPTKLGEFLALGLPVITNSGIGDVDQIVADTRAGVVIESFDVDAYERATANVDDLRRLDRNAIRDAARRIYDLDLAVDAYARLYASIGVQP